MRTIVYVDGFNLYYGALKSSPWKWLDLLLLFETILQPHHDIQAIKYFTARVSSTSGDPSKPQRQDVCSMAIALKSKPILAVSSATGCGRRWRSRVGNS